MNKQESTKNSIIIAIKDIIAGTIGGIGIVAVGHPFDTVKTQPVEKPIYTGMIDCFKKTLGWEGPLGLYKGVASPLIGQMLFNAVQFCAYGQAKKLVQGKDDFLTIPGYLKAGFLTGIIVSYYSKNKHRFVESPMDLFKSQLQYQIFHQRLNPETFKPEFSGVFDCCRKTVKQYGIKGFFQGIVPTLFRDSLAVSLYIYIYVYRYFGSYELVRRSFLKPGQHPNEVDKLPASVILLAGGVGGFSYWVSILPLDCIKSAIMTDSIHPEKKVYKGIVDCAKKLYAKGGLKIFFKGSLPCLIRSAPANAVCFLCYTKTRDIIG